MSHLAIAFNVFTSRTNSFNNVLLSISSCVFLYSSSSTNNHICQYSYSHGSDIYLDIIKSSLSFSTLSIACGHTLIESACHKYFQYLSTICAFASFRSSSGTVENFTYCQYLLCIISSDHCFILYAINSIALHGQLASRKAKALAHCFL